MPTPRNHALLAAPMPATWLCALLLAAPAMVAAQPAAPARSLETPTLSRPPAPAAAEPSADAADSPAYRAAIADAVRAFSAGHWSEARAAFERAHALAPSARTLRGLGLAAFYLHDPLAAREAFEHALAESHKPLPDEQRVELQRLLAQTVRETGRFELRLRPAAARLLLDGLARDDKVLLLARGTHSLGLEAEGYQPLHTQLEVEGAEDRVLELSLAPETSLQPALVRVPEPRPPAAARAPEAARVNARLAAGAATPARGSAASARLWAWVTLAAVPVFAGSAGALWTTGLAKHDRIERACATRCDQAEIDRRVRAADLPAYELGSSVSLVAAAGALLASGVLFFVQAGKPEADGGSALRLGSSCAHFVTRF